MTPSRDMRLLIKVSGFLLVCDLGIIAGNIVAQVAASGSSTLFEAVRTWNDVAGLLVGPFALLVLISMREDSAFAALVAIGGGFFVARRLYWAGLLFAAIGMAAASFLCGRALIVR